MSIIYKQSYSFMIISEKVYYTKDELKTEYWKHIHTVTKPQKYYKRGTKLYVSNLGRCKAGNKIIQLRPRKNGYLTFLNIPLHRLIYTTFIDKNIDGLDIDHIDRNRQNNRIVNLKACTRKENMANTNTKKELKESRNREEYKQYQRDNNLGRFWINNGCDRKKLFPNECIEYIKNGWKYGYKL